MTSETIFKQSIIDEPAMHALAARFAAALSAGTVVYLVGSLGAGKTTWTRGFLRALGFNDKVKSPTYTLVEPYQTARYAVNHFDLYRLKSPQELSQIGLEEYFNPQAVCLIEWPDKGGEYLPSPDLTGYFEMVPGAPSERLVRFEAITANGKQILTKLNQ